MNNEYVEGLHLTNPNVEVVFPISIFLLTCVVHLRSLGIIRSSMDCSLLSQNDVHQMVKLCEFLFS